MDQGSGTASTSLEPRGSEDDRRLLWGFFMAINKETAVKRNVSRARILVKLKGKERPSVANILEGARSFKGSDMVGDPTKMHCSLPVEGDKGTITKGEGGRRRTLNTRWKKRVDFSRDHK